MNSDDAILNKSAAIERCLKRIREEYTSVEDLFGTNFTKQDSIVLNLQRACEASIDLSNYIVKKRKLGIPQQSREAFDLLAASGIIPLELCEKMKRMVGFRNLAVHAYQALDMKVVKSIVEDHLQDFSTFTSHIIKQNL
jgi:uncharacterized protein YutE (UPF0331/DUF86 family)